MLEKLVAFRLMPKDSLAQAGTCLHCCPQHTAVGLNVSSFSIRSM